MVPGPCNAALVVLTPEKEYKRTDDQVLSAPSESRDFIIILSFWTFVFAINLLIFYRHKVARPKLWSAVQLGPNIIKLFSCSTQLSMKFYLLINTKLLISTVVFLLSLAACEVFYAYKYENAKISWRFHSYQQRKIHAQLSLSMKKVL